MEISYVPAFSLSIRNKYLFIVGIVTRANITSNIISLNNYNIKKLLLLNIEFKTFYNIYKPNYFYEASISILLTIITATSNYKCAYNVCMFELEIADKFCNFPSLQ